MINDGEIREKITYREVDFNNVETVVHYGKEIKDEIITIFNSASEDSNDYVELELTEDLIKDIGSFGDKLDEVDKQNEKYQKSFAFKIKKGLKKIGLKNINTDVVPGSYKEQYEEYKLKLEKTIEIVRSQQEASKSDAETRQLLARQLTPFLEQLLEVIEAGKIKREQFNEEIEIFKKELEDYKMNPETCMNYQIISEMQNKVLYKLKLLDLFNERLTDLDNDLVRYKQKREGFLLQQLNELQILMSSERFLNDGIIELITLASEHIFNRKQEKRIKTCETLDQVLNDAAIENSELLKLNVAGVNRLSMNSGVTLNTTLKVQEKLEQALKLYIKGREEKKLYNEKRTLVLQDINETIDKNIEEMVEVVGIQTALDGFISNDSKKLTASKQKKLVYNPRKNKKN